MRPCRAGLDLASMNSESLIVVKTCNDSHLKLHLLQFLYFPKPMNKNEDRKRSFSNRQRWSRFALA